MGSLNSLRPVRYAVTSTFSDAHMWNLVYLQRLLEERGGEVVNVGACASDELILAECRRFGPDLLVVSTVNGHGHIDGLSLIRKIRDDPELATLAVVIGGKLGINGPGAADLEAELIAHGYNAVFETGSIPDFEAFLDSFESVMSSRTDADTGRTIGRDGPMDGRLVRSGRMGNFSRFMTKARSRNGLVLQPRMGFGDVATMRSGLEEVRDRSFPTIGTITVDSYTRVNDHEAARRSLTRGDELNGFPVVAHGPRELAELIADVQGEGQGEGQGDGFPIQVRHGSALPAELFRVVAEAGIDAAEGGPVSYCLPYSRVPLVEAVKAWEVSCQFLADLSEPFHMESFGGCMQGQLCPPSLLVALSVLEGLFFREQGLRSISLSYAQQTHFGQDLEALAALRALAGQWLPDADWHVVLYTYMGVFPRTATGAFKILDESVRLAVRSGTERLIVKTPAEGHRIPTVSDNVDALEYAAAVTADESERPTRAEPADTGVYEEAARLIESTLDNSSRVGLALVRAFQSGRLDVPYCLHRDNAYRARAGIDSEGRLYWSDPGAMPLGSASARHDGWDITARGLLDMLHYNQRRFDAAPSSPSHETMSSRSR